MRFFPANYIYILSHLLLLKLSSYKISSTRSLVIAFDNNIGETKVAEYFLNEIKKSEINIRSVAETHMVPVRKRIVAKYHGSTVRLTVFKVQFTTPSGTFFVFWPIQMFIFGKLASMQRNIKNEITINKC